MRLRILCKQGGRAAGTQHRSNFSEAELEAMKELMRRCAVISGMAADVRPN